MEGDAVDKINMWPYNILPFLINLTMSNFLFLFILDYPADWLTPDGYGNSDGVSCELL